MSNINSKKNKDVLKWTDNNSVYNKTRKRFLERNGLISCSHCKYHRGENRKIWFGGYIKKGQRLKDGNFSYPPWKLASKNRKQWMPKNNVKMKITPSNYRYWKKEEEWLYIEFKFIRNKSGIKYSSK